MYVYIIQFSYINLQHKFMHTRIYINTCRWVRVQMGIHLNVVRLLIHTSKYINTINTDIHTHTYIHIYIHVYM